jgi:hypothetical protein
MPPREPSVGSVGVIRQTPQKAFLCSLKVRRMWKVTAALKVEQAGSWPIHTSAATRLQAARTED